MCHTILGRNCEEVLKALHLPYRGQSYRVVSSLFLINTWFLHNLFPFPPALEASHNCFIYDFYPDLLRGLRDSIVACGNQSFIQRCAGRRPRK